MGPTLRFWWHFAEMMLAMAVGMGVLAPVWTVLTPDLYDRPGPGVMLMAVNMAIGMAAWMAIRGHDRRMIGEMSVAMVAPFAVLLAPYAAGWISRDTMSLAGHLLMIAAMLGIMLVRRDHYSQRQSWAWRLRSPAVPQ